MPKHQNQRVTRQNSMPRRSVGGIPSMGLGIPTVAIGILVTIAVYSLLATSLYSNIMIYDNIPFKESALPNVSISIKNNAALTLPFVSPSYLVTVLLVENTTDVHCGIPSSRGELPCDGRSMLDLSTIAPGHSAQMPLLLDANQVCCVGSAAYPGNFTIRISVYMSFFTTFLIKSKTISCSNASFGKYICSET